MAGAFTMAAADYAKGKIESGAINRIDIKATGETVSQYQDFGKIVESSLKLTNQSQKTATLEEVQLGFMVEFTAKVLAHSSNLRTAVAALFANSVDAKVTLKNGDSFAFTGGLYGDGDLTIDEEIGGDGTSSKYLVLHYKGTILKANWLTAFTAHA